MYAALWQPVASALRALIVSLGCVLLLCACPDRPVSPRLEAGLADGGLDAPLDARLGDSLSPDAAAVDGRCRVSVVSVTSGGQVANAASHSPAISRDGKLVAFASKANNLSPAASGGVFLRDIAKKTTSLVSVDTSGTPIPSGTGPVSVSADGRYIGFHGLAKHLTPGGDPTTTSMARHDMVAGKTEIVSVTTTGSPGGASRGRLSGDGRWAVFSSYSSNLVPGDTNNKTDVFLRSIVAKTTVRLSVGHDGSQCGEKSDYPSISHDGSLVSFASDCLLVPVTPSPPQKYELAYLRGPAGQLTLVSTSKKWGTTEGRRPVISGDGRFVVYTTARDPDTDLVAPYRNLYLYDVATKQHTRLTRSSSGGEPDNDIVLPAISSKGRYVSFSSRARNLVTGGGNGWFGAYLIDRQAGTTTLVSVDRQGNQLDSSSGNMGNNTSVADDGSVAFDATVTGCGGASGICVYVYQGCD